MIIKMKQHGKQQEQLKKEYESKGYKVYVEANVPQNNSFVIVDILAEKDGKKTIIEIGNCTQAKLEFLKTKFDEVIHLPYLSKSEDGYLKHICGHIWEPRVESPKECPRCKGRIDNG